MQKASIEVTSRRHDYFIYALFNSGETGRKRLSLKADKTSTTKHLTCIHNDLIDVHYLVFFWSALPT